MYIFNASFMISRDKENAFLEWLRRRCVEYGDRMPSGMRISAMRESGGVDFRRSEVQTLACQWEFQRFVDDRRWSKTGFAEIASGFESEFGPDAMVYTSIFEVV